MLRLRARCHEFYWQFRPVRDCLIFCLTFTIYLGIKTAYTPETWSLRALLPCLGHTTSCLSMIWQIKAQQATDCLALEQSMDRFCINSATFGKLLPYSAQYFPLGSNLLSIGFLTPRLTVHLCLIACSSISQRDAFQNGICCFHCSAVRPETSVGQNDGCRVCFTGLLCFVVAAVAGRTLGAGYCHLKRRIAR